MLMPLMNWPCNAALSFFTISFLVSIVFLFLINYWALLWTSQYLYYGRDVVIENLTEKHRPRAVSHHDFLMHYGYNYFSIRVIALPGHFSWQMSLAFLCFIERMVRDG